MSHEKMQDYFQKFLHMHGADGEGIKLLEHLEEENPQYDETKKIGADNHHALLQNLRSCIPFREIREALLRYAYDSGIVTSIIEKPDTRFLYMVAHDSDIVHLQWLYSHYFELLSENGFPTLASTGYQTARENHPHDAIILAVEQAINGKSRKQKTDAIKALCEINQLVKVALNVQGMAYCDAYNKYCKEHDSVSYDVLSKNISLDMFTREALSLSDPRLLYWPEPNMVFKVFDRQISATITNRYSFITQGVYTDPYESSILLRSIYSQSASVTAVFSPYNPVELRLNESFMAAKTPASLPQAHYTFRDSAIVAYRQLGINSHMRSTFVSTLSNLYSLFSKASFLNLSKEAVDSVHIEPFCAAISPTFNIVPAINFEKSVMAIGKIPYAVTEVDDQETEESS